MKRGIVPDLGKASLLALVYLLLAKLGLTIQPVNAFASLVWAPSGVALAAMLLMGYRFWPSIAVGAVAANLWTGAPLLVALGIGAGNTLEALAGAWVLRRIPGFRTSLDRLQDVLGLILLSGVLSTTISASIGVSSLVLGGVIPAGQAVTTWRVWWLGDLVGDLLVAPVLLTWNAPRPAGRRAARFVEGAVLAALVTVATMAIFERSETAMAALLSPFLVWAAIRFEQRGAARANLLVCAIAVWATARGHGPFAQDGAPQALFATQEFMALTVGTFLVLGAVIAERRRAEGELTRASAAKDRFLAALSHELRTPLTPVLAISSALERDAALPAAARRQIETLRKNAELEARLIDDLLDLTRIAHEKLKLSPEPVEVGEALDQAFEVCRSEVAAKGLIVERDPAGAGRFVRADPARLRQVLWNLLKNAIQFTPAEGRIRIRVLQPEHARIAIEISDTGVGIEPTEVGRIFVPFQQLERRVGGLGLGLAISRALVEAQGGALNVSSPGRGHGSTFRVELPAAEPAASSRPPLPAAGTRASAGPRRVLLVEDHADTLAALRDLLTEMSCDVVTAGTLREAFAAAEAGSFELVLSDLGLPDGSGLELMRSLRERYGLAGIAVTGYGMEEDLRRSLAAGFVEHLVKPITFEKLETAIDRFFAERERSAAPV